MTSHTPSPGSPAPDAPSPQPNGRQILTALLLILLILFGVGWMIWKGLSAASPSTSIRLTAPSSGIPDVSAFNPTPVADAPAFILSMAQDKQGNLWVGDEDKGLCRINLATGRKQSFTTADGLGDNHIYALAVDHQGRLWAGHLNHGVSVYNGQKWQNYEAVAGLSNPDSLAGPLGQRVFDIAVCPTDGDVWIATNCGLARYRDAGRDSSGQTAWTYYTRAQGLPSNQVQALAFDQQGNLYAGTQCDGLAIAQAADHYKTWRQVTGPDKMPTDPSGRGLPGNLINDVLVGHDGTIYVATTRGLAASMDHGNSWTYWRGMDWAEKVRDLYGGPPKGWTERPGAWLAEDYITCLAEDAQGRLWIGTRAAGYRAVNPHTHASLYISADDPQPFVNAILPAAGGAWIGCYSDGLIGPAHPQSPAADSPSNPTAPAALPSGAKPPTLAQLDAIIQRVQALPKPTGAPTAAYLASDWSTQGDWVGRYGRQFNVLCSPFDRRLVSNSLYSITGQIGPHHKPGQGMYGYIYKINSFSPSSLYDPSAGVRIEAEWNGAGQEYPFTYEGPDVWIHINVPQGIQRVSFYFCNSNGHDRRNRYRDYRLDLYPGSTDMTAVNPGPPLARGRVRDFAGGGVYTQFIVSGPGAYWFRLGKNYSFNMRVSGIFIDRLAGPSSRFDGLSIPALGGVRYDPPSAGAAAGPATKLWQVLDEAWARQGIAAIEPAARLMAIRFAAAHSASPDLLANWRWRRDLWTAADREQFNTTMNSAWTALLKDNPELKQKARTPLGQSDMPG